MTPNELAEESKLLLANPILKKAFADVREELVLGLESLPMGDKDSQHEVALSLQVLKRLQTKLLSYTQSTVVDKYRQKQASFIEKTREKLT